MKFYSNINCKYIAGCADADVPLPPAPAELAAPQPDPVHGRPGPVSWQPYGQESREHLQWMHREGGVGGGEGEGWEGEVKTLDTLLESLSLFP